MLDLYLTRTEKKKKEDVIKRQNEASRRRKAVNKLRFFLSEERQQKTPEPFDVMRVFSTTFYFFILKDLRVGG